VGIWDLALAGMLAGIGMDGRMEGRWAGRLYNKLCQLTPIENLLSVKLPVPQGVAGCSVQESFLICNR